MSRREQVMLEEAKLRSILIMCLLLLAIGGGYLGWNNLLNVGNQIYLGGGAVMALLAAVLVIMLI